MVLFDLLTKGLNKVIAPKLLRLSLRIHKSIPVNAISLLPLSQRLVSIEVQDDYRQLLRKSAQQQHHHHHGILAKTFKSFDEFVERTWNVLGLEQLVDKEIRADENNNNNNSRRSSENSSNAQDTTNHDSSKSTSETNDEILAHKSHERVRLLETYLRPALASTSLEEPPPPTFVKWIRGEYLIAKYGLHVQDAIRNYPELKDDAAGLSIFDVQTLDGKDAEFPLDAILPTVKTVRRAFDMEGWSSTKVPVSLLNEGSPRDVDRVSIEEIIHYRLRGQVAFSGPLNAYFEMRRREDSYELWTKDYIFGLAEYILDRIKEMNDKSGDMETVVLDVGAGDGRLIYFLRRAMKEIVTSKNMAQIGRKGLKPKLSMPTLIATDDGSWRAPMYKTSHIQVERLSAQESIEKYAPKSNEDNRRLIILCSWMPPGDDWTALFRKADQKDVKQLADEMEPTQRKAANPVQEYLLIGECDDGTCGHNFYTWGNPDFHPSNEAAIKESIEPPYSQDGYVRIDLEDLSELQFSRFDCKRSSESKTVSFRRSR